MTGERLRRTLRANLAAFAPEAAPIRDGDRRAAVAVTVLDASTTPRVLVCKRVARGTNPGQWALPGGRLEPGESAEAAATREAAEEVGLRDLEVLGRLDDFVADSRFVITPVVCLAPEPAVLRRNRDELHSLHPIALARLLDDRVLRWARRADGPPLLQMLLRHDMVVHAPTGAILWQFREVALLGRKTRVAGSAQPDFARR
jgi:8-oxo-dGTP pyrophosphatase MutT (NUDIX family)